MIQYRRLSSFKIQIYHVIHRKSLEQLLSEPYKNDCEKVVINHYSNVEKALNWLLQYAPARLTGTGACVFAEFDHEAEAQAVFRQNQKHFWFRR